jgi:hypothetical protein
MAQAALAAHAQKRGKRERAEHENKKESHPRGGDNAVDHGEQKVRIKAIEADALERYLPGPFLIAANALPERPPANPDALSSHKRLSCTGETT